MEELVSRAHATASPELRCIACGGLIRGPLAALGSMRCDDCRDQDQAVAHRADSAVAAAVAWADELARELDRSRRYERPFALVGLGPVAHMDALRRALRSVDLAWVFDGCTFVLLPESGRAVADGLLGRLAVLDPPLADRSARVAVFPDDGVTARGLLAAAYRHSANGRIALNGHAANGDAPGGDATRALLRRVVRLRARRRGLNDLGHGAD